MKIGQKTSLLVYGIHPVDGLAGLLFPTEGHIPASEGLAVGEKLERIMLIDFKMVSHVETRDEDNTGSAACCWYYYINFIVAGQPRGQKFAIQNDDALAKKQRDAMYDLFLKNCPQLQKL